MERESFSPLYYLRILKKWKNWILAPAFVIAFVVLVMGLLSPRPYMAEVTILLSGGNFSLNNPPLGAMLGFPSLSLGNPNVEIVLSMIHSKRMAEDVVDRFKLVEKYGPSKARLIKKVRDMIDAEEMKAGVIIQVTTTDPQLSSDIANFCVLNLNVINEQLGITTEKPIAKVLDLATPPTEPSSRKIISRVVMAFFVWVAGCTFIVFLREYLQELHRREDEEQALSVGLGEKEEVLL